eukprot:m.23989 g.23989  ORF g.23989 m.23989 type:complete len:259 (-) comp5603_c1_seq1:256-1032(-)
MTSEARCCVVSFTLSTGSIFPSNLEKEKKKMEQYIADVADVAEVAEVADDVNETKVADVLVTGFEIFGNHCINPSWEIMKEFDGCTLEGATIVARELPVCYEEVDSRYPKLLEELPGLKLIVNCGVGLPGGLKLESRCRNGPYFRLDNHGTHPAKKCCDNNTGIENEFLTSVPTDDIIAACKKECPDLLLELSVDAGLYLCEYTYYHSIHSNRCPSIFLHVPPYGNPYDHNELKSYVQAILKELIKSVTCCARSNKEE